MIDFITTLKTQVDQKIRLIESGKSNILNKALAAAKILEDAFDQLKKFISAHTFSTEEQEIEFFKSIKPQIFSYLLYYRKVYNIEMNRPLGVIDSQVSYLNNELNAIQHYVEKRLDFYRYIRSGNTAHDREYFLRGNVVNNSQYLDSFYFERDPIFSTNGDFRVAKIFANDMLLLYIHNELTELKRKENTFGAIPDKLHDIPRWTSTKTGLIEIIYSLHYLGSIDEGEMSLRLIQTYFEEWFGLSLGNISRAFAEMRIRNDPTPFLDSMKKALLDKMDTSEMYNLINDKRT